MAAQRMRADALEWVRDALVRFEAAIDAMERQEAGHLHAEFHLGIYEVSGSELLNVLRWYWSRLQLQLSERVYTTEMPRRFVQEHRGILAALERSDAKLASERMRAHIEHGRKTMGRSLRDGHRSPSGGTNSRPEKKS